MWYHFYDDSCIFCFVLKHHCQLQRNFTGNIYGMSSMRFPHFRTIIQQTWSPWTILDSDCLKFNKSSPLKLWGTMNCRNDVWEILYKMSIFHANRATNVATICSSCFWLSKKIFSKIICSFYEQKKCKINLKDVDALWKV